jgi:hypothetical protein
MHDGVEVNPCAMSAARKTVRNTAVNHACRPRSRTPARAVAGSRGRRVQVGLVRTLARRQVSVWSAARVMHLRPAAPVALLCLQQAEEFPGDPDTTEAALFIRQRTALRAQFVNQHADASDSFFRIRSGNVRHSRLRDRATASAIRVFPRTRVRDNHLNQLDVQKIRVRRILHALHNEAPGREPSCC